jgi:hypothetical protein
MVNDSAKHNDRGVRWESVRVVRSLRSFILPAYLILALVVLLVATFFALRHYVAALIVCWVVLLLIVRAIVLGYVRTDLKAHGLAFG